MKKAESIAARPPIVAVVGHIDHGKSTLLDYIRKTNVVEGEAGGITQHLSAYEAEHHNASGTHKITFLDTPGHAAFAAMRSRGLEVADVAILIVSAEDGAKPQTVEAIKLIEEAKIPYIVAFTKIDKPGANLEKAKMSMLEHSVFLEGLGGEVPWVGISSKSGEGIPELLDLILLAAELEGLSTDASAPGSGLVIEARIDPKRGNTATLMIQEGSLSGGTFVVSGKAFAPVRIMENFLGKPIKEGHAGSPVRIVGFSSLPTVGDTWTTVKTKKEAEAAATESRSLPAPARASAGTKPSPTLASSGATPETEENKAVLPLVIKTDVAGTGEAVAFELSKMPADARLEVRIVSQSVGTISEGDVKLVAGSKTPGIIVGFGVKVENAARDLAERQGVTIQVFDVIYKLTEWLAAEIETRRPRSNSEERTGSAKVLKFFSGSKGRVVIGGRVEEGEIREGEIVKIMRHEMEIGRGEITSLQTGKTPTKKVEAGLEFGAQIKTHIEPANGDYLEAFEVVLK